VITAGYGQWNPVRVTTPNKTLCTSYAPGIGSTPTVASLRCKKSEGVETSPACPRKSQDARRSKGETNVTKRPNT